MKKEYSILLVFLILVLTINFTFAQAEFNVCCEKTTSGAWCQNTEEAKCDNNYRKSPTSCYQTSYCRAGCCVDSDEGLCMENTPERVCEEAAGSWVDDSVCNIPQCNLGCCVLGDQASFVTLTRCKKLAGLFGLETNFLTNILDETTCIAVANSQDKGACVMNLEDQKDCKFLTRGECATIEGSQFYNDVLCSADELSTNCGPTEETTCVEGKQEVYFKDSCGNIANIYDASKVYSKDPSYWQEVVLKADSCGSNQAKGNMGSEICGNCEYFSGSICSEGDATYGNYYCKDLNCYNTNNGEDYKNGESWCVFQGPTGAGQDLVGSRHFRHICINGEEITEACDPMRKDYCYEEAIETASGDFSEAACIANRHVSCTAQIEEEDCMNTDIRDCYWLKGYSVVNEEYYQGYKKEGSGVCLPEVPPGLTFWEDGAEECEQVDTHCTLVDRLLDGLAGGDENKNCKDATWPKDINNICISVGDCGTHKNIAGKTTDGGGIWMIDGGTSDWI
jgi:hypothetical protein